MSIKLRELIRAVRACKTAEEERAVITKECALIRTSFKDNHAQFRHRNVAKLLFIHMLGYPSHFGQMECVKLIASPQFPEKRIGYLGLMLLLDERTEVLTLVTNSLKNDLNNQNIFIASLALTAVGNLGTPDMMRDLAPDIDKHLKSTLTYLRKKAALSTIRILKKAPEIIDEFIDRIVSLLKDTSHGVLLTGLQLMIEVVQISPNHIQTFIRLVPSLVRLLRNLISMGYSPEHDVTGITDPFLQVKLLRLLKLLGTHQPEASETMNDILAQVATNTETAKNAGNAILYECVRTIMSVQSESGLRVLAINILGRFLLNRDNNIRYVALNTLSSVVNEDIQSVQRHRSTIIDCLKDPDISIRQRAVDLIFQLINGSNITTSVLELLNYLVVAPTEHRSKICSNLMEVIEKFSPSRYWMLNTLVTMLSIAGNQCDETIASSAVVYISQSEELHPFIIHKIYSMLKSDLSQLALIHVAVWCIGEFGDLLLTDYQSNQNDSNNFSAVSPKEIVDLLEKIMKLHSATILTKLYVMTAAMKLTARLNGQEITRLEELISTYQTSMVLELQQRSCEFSNLLQPNWNTIRNDMLNKMPVLDEAVLQTKRGQFADKDNDNTNNNSNEQQANNSNNNTSNNQMNGKPHLNNNLIVPANNSMNQAPDLLGLDDMFGNINNTIIANNNSINLPSSTTNNISNNNNNNNNNNNFLVTSDVDLLADIFSTNTIQSNNSPFATNQPIAPVVLTPNVINNNNNNQSFATSFNNNNNNQMNQPIVSNIPTTPSLPIVNAYEKNGLYATFELSKPEPSNPSITNVLCRFTNSNSYEITSFLFQAAVPKYIKLEMRPPSGDVIPIHRSGAVEQIVQVTNTALNQKPLMMKIKLQYNYQGQQINEMAQVSNFPTGY